jgi:hypothetical protein
MDVKRHAMFTDDDHVQGRFQAVDGDPALGSNQLAGLGVAGARETPHERDAFAGEELR